MIGLFLNDQSSIRSLVVIKLHFLPILVRQQNLIWIQIEANPNFVKRQHFLQ